MNVGFVAQLLVSGLALGSIYALVALGFTLIFATTRVVNFAQGEFVMLGALVGYSAHVSAGLPLGPAVLVAGLVTVLAGLIAERVAVYPLRALQSSIAWVISTLGLGMMLKSGAAEVWGKVPVAFPAPFGLGRVELFGTAFVPQEAVTVVVAIALMLALEALYRATIFGKAMRAVAYDRDTAKLMGINVSTMSLISFGISAALAAIAGLLVSPITNASPEMGTVLGIKGFAAAAVGGLGTFQGAFLGGILLGVMEVLASGLLWPGFYDVAAFGLLILVLLARPTGLVGARVVVRA
ncbi:MAG TPA: branched-chain amino acid ABC transporter permease [Chloroflexota bacterium]|nr:branched-chain amino acid ABC transporter permease [Chloroflexota bacterium]